MDKTITEVLKLRRRALRHLRDSNLSRLILYGFDEIEDQDYEEAYKSGYNEGYKDGFNQPEWQWNAEVSKNIGAFTLSLKAHDILNQTRGRNHTVTANYEEDSYRLVLGRYILFGVKWNFGKMNAAHSRRAQQAAWNMAW